MHRRIKIIGFTLVDDSTFVEGCTTNAKGDFKLEVSQTDKVLRLVFNYLGYKGVVMNILPTKEINVRLGDIVMKKDAVQIHEVTVLGETPPANPIHTGRGRSLLFSNCSRAC